MKLPDIAKMYVGDRTVTWMQLGATPVWPMLEKPVVSVEHMLDLAPYYMLGISWTWPNGATECWVYVDDAKVAEVTEPWDGEHGYYEGGNYNYGSTHDVYVKAFVFAGSGATPKASRQSDTVTHTIADPAYTGQTFTIKLIPSKDNIYGWTTGDGVKLYACFQGNNWPSADHRAAFRAKYDNLSSPSLNFYMSYDIDGTMGSQEYFVGPVIMDNASVYPEYLTELGQSDAVYYNNIILLDANFSGSGSGWTAYGRLVFNYEYWTLTLNGVTNTYRFYIEWAQGGVGAESLQLPTM